MTIDELKQLIRRKAKDARFDVHFMGNAALDDLRELGTLTMDQNNRICELRNRLKDYIYKQLSDILLAVETGEVLNPKHKTYKPSPAGDAIEITECQICGESRAVQKCHVMPSHLGGNRRDNLILLCPTHHFLFDHCRLNREEINRISLDEIDDRSREYYDKVTLKRHRENWSRE